MSSTTVESSSSPPRNNLTDSLHPEEEEVEGVQRYFSLTRCVTNKTTAGKGSHDDSQRLHKSNRTLHSLLQESSQGWVREPRGKLGLQPPLVLSNHSYASRALVIKATYYHPRSSEVVDLEALVRNPRSHRNFGRLP